MAEQTVEAGTKLGPQDPWARFLELAQEAYPYVLALAGNNDEAEEVMQEMAVSFSRRTEPFLRAEHPKAYLHTWARNSVLRAKQRRKILAHREQTGAEMDGFLHPAQDENAEEAKAAARALQALRDDLREVVVLRIYQGLTFREIGEVLGAPLQTVVSRYQRALDELHELLEGQIDGA